MNTDFIKGVVVPILTPIDADERIDEARLRAQVDYVIDGGVSGILAFGSNGEFYISIKNDANGDAMAIIADLAVIDTDETGTSIDGIEDNSNGEGISIRPEDGGITIATDNKTSVKAVKIYSVTGMVVRTVNLNGSSKFVPLEAGLYIVGGKTVAVK